MDSLWVFDVGTGTERLVADATALGAGPGELPDAERALRERLRLSAGGIGSYAIDPLARVAAFGLGGGLVTVDLHADADTGPTVRPAAPGRR